MPRGRDRMVVAWVGLALVALVGAGCTHAIPLKPVVSRPDSLKSVPLAVGVYYSPEFREHQHVGSRLGDRWAFPLGPASVALLDQAFPMIFEAVVPVTTRSPQTSGPQKVAAVIEPAIEDFDFVLPMLKTSTYSADIGYRFTLFSPDGVSLASWTVQGSGAKSGQLGFEFARWPGEAADLAMQDAAVKFLTGFRQVPEVGLWLRRQGVGE